MFAHTVFVLCTADVSWWRNDSYFVLITPIRVLECWLLLTRCFILFINREAPPPRPAKSDNLRSPANRGHLPTVPKQRPPQRHPPHPGESPRMPPIVQTQNQNDSDSVSTHFVITLQNQHFRKGICHSRQNFWFFLISLKIIRLINTYRCSSTIYEKLATFPVFS